ncbi:MAG: hypothetical protein ACPG5B_15080 [Chitinophagales bacterium]
MKKQRNYPGDLRTPGTKGYGIILSNLRKYCHYLKENPDDDKIYELFLKIKTKLKELGYRKESLNIERKMKSMANWDKKRKDVMVMSVKVWKEAKEKHDITKEKKKKKAKQEQKRVVKKTREESKLNKELPKK